ncbi:MAG: hypothetical protein SXQ77_13380 [Halobacteria archaeon]|nr:hypothetical protein [Halobacteria archaeon]
MGKDDSSEVNLKEYNGILSEDTGEELEEVIEELRERRKWRIEDRNS